MLRAMQLGQHALFVLLLLVGALRGAGSAGVLVLAGAEFAWYVSGLWFARRGSRGGIWLAVLLAGWLALVLLAPDFVWLAFALFFLCFHLLPTVAAIAATAALTAVAIAASIGHGTANPTAAVLGPLFGALVASGTALIYRQLVRDAEQRDALLTELTAAHRELLDAQDELVRLQRETGATAERARLARDIHDTLAQGFSSILLLARAGLRTGGDTAALLGRIEETARRNLVEARRVVDKLRPSDLDDAPLAAALGRVLDRLRGDTGIDAELRVDGEPLPLPTGFDVALLRVAQSALANVRLHARARRVRVTLAYAPDEVRLDVVDDGAGFDVDAAGSGGGFGLTAMRDRLAELGGAVVVESAPGDGTAVAATLPVRMLP
ncbi:sensor histidine kinase [Rhodococcus ruber]|nr:sensor histidine kinase [Rhodococcus ruber]RIK11727.1 MAG: sensor histidine kinase [Acidobacteriota bacterium]AUM19776.1 sensor histidine kinase [Rhodococcus ruber]MBD8052528.1 sensor histidine kinase [Rhodococcus ruber]MCF8783838.1 sensor histidine kinase [Rhodococcus ruber]